MREVVLSQRKLARTSKPNGVMFHRVRLPLPFHLVSTSGIREAILRNTYTDSAIIHLWHSSHRYCNPQSVQFGRRGLNNDKPVQLGPTLVSNHPRAWTSWCHAPKSQPDTTVVPRRDNHILSTTSLEITAAAATTATTRTSLRPYTFHK